MKNLIKSESEQFRQELQLALNSQLFKLKDMQPDFIGWRDFKPNGSSLAYCSNSLYEYNKPTIKETAFHYMQEILWLNRKGFKVVIRTSNLVKNAFLKRLEEMDMCNSIIIYKRGFDSIQMFCFIFRSNNLSTMNFFVNEKEKFETIAEQCLKRTSDISNNSKYLSLREQLFSKEQATSIFEESPLLMKQQSNHGLSDRQKECLDLVVQGATNKDIANILNICPKTVEYHLKNIRATLNCHTRFEIKHKMTQQLI